MTIINIRNKKIILLYIIILILYSGNLLYFYVCYRQLLLFVYSEIKCDNENVEVKYLILKQ